MQAPAATPAFARKPLIMTRPNGPLFGGVFALGDAAHLQRHGFAFNRKVHADDLSHVTPAHVSAWDAKHYVFQGGLWHSKHAHKVILADINKVDEHAVKAMLAAGLRFAMRVPRGDHSTSVHLVGDHAWALWGWSEAVARGDVQQSLNVLVHIDDHPDLSQLLIDRLMLELPDVERFIERYVRNPSDVLGVESFILPAALAHVIGSMLWVYGDVRTAETDFFARIQHQLIMEGIEADMPAQGVPSEIGKSFVWGASAYRSDCVPAALFTWFTSFAHRYMLDVDTDVADQVDDLVRIVNPYLNAYAFPGCITIAVSPQWGAYENHVEKVMAMLGLIRERAVQLSCAV